MVGPDALVGVSTQSIEQARQAVLDGANYIGVGPTYPSATKAFGQFPGVDLLRAVAAEIRLPAFAIGGISRENLAEVLAAGFTRVAAGAAVTAADDPAGAASGTPGGNDGEPVECQADARIADGGARASGNEAMTKTFEQGKSEVAALCRYFATNREAFLAPGVKEAHVRQTLIDPFFEALGWDVRNAARIAPQYREVIPEDSLDVEGHQKAPDYTFRVGTLAKFYAEAKKCGVDISADPAPAYQLRRYGWSAKVALSLLTNFEELGVLRLHSPASPERQGQPRPNPILPL